MLDEGSRGSAHINWAAALAVSVILHAVAIFLFVSGGGDRAAEPAARPSGDPAALASAERRPGDPPPPSGAAAAEAETSETPAARDPSGPAAETPEPRPAIYVVQSGDSLTRIAKRYGLTVSELAKANGIAANAGLRIGQRLKLPR